MAEQRQPFRFRLPWLSAMNVPRPTSEPQLPRPTPEIQAPAQPIPSAPILRPPFRPAGIAPAQSPPQTQPAPRTEPQPPTSYRSPTQFRVASQPASPSRATQTRAASVPPESRVTSQPASPSRATTQTRSPSRATTQSRAASVPPSPLRTASQTQPTIQAGAEPQSPSRSVPQITGQTSSQPSSPMRKPVQVQPTATAVSQHPSPSEKSQPSTKDTPQPPLNLTTAPSYVTREQEPKPAGILQLSQEPQPKTQIKSEIVSESQFQSGAKTTHKPDSVPEKRAQASDSVKVVPLSTLAPEAPAAPQKLESVPAKVDPQMARSESEKRLKETEREKDPDELVREAKSEDGKKIARQLVKEEKSDGSAEETGRTITKFITRASGLEKQSKSKELLGARIQTKEKKQEKNEIFERKKPQASSLSDEKHIKTVSSTHQNDRNILGNHQKLAISNGERAPLHKEIREDISKFVHKLAKQPMDDRPVNIITVAGENRGASMHLGRESAKKDGSVHIHRGYKLQSDEIPEATTDGEGNSRRKNPRDPTAKKDQASRAYINSNSQSINNSILFSSSVSERNPGVQMVLSHNLAEPSKSTIKPETLETHKAEFSITPAQNLTYQPTVRRRCLRGLFLEPSDSDPDNPEKPQRHGCLYNCGKKSKDKDIELL